MTTKAPDECNCGSLGLHVGACMSEKTLVMDGEEHGVECGFACRQRACDACNTYMHFQPVYGGIFYECPECRRVK